MTVTASIKNFTTVTRSRYEAMNKRLKGLPFYLCDFREFVLDLLKSREDGYCQCAYCNRPLDISTLRLDHETPIERGGSKELTNLCPACDECNRLKGKMTAPEFRQFISMLRQLGPAAESDICKRLKTGEGFMRIRYYEKRAR